MEIKNESTLAEKQAYWAEQLPNFEAKYWLPSHFDLLKFDMDQGSYVVKDDLDPTYEDDADEIWHRVNTGWAMWKRAISFSKVPEGFVLVPKEPTQELYRSFYDAFNSANAGNTAQRFKIAYKAMIEAQEQSHD